MQQSGLWTFFLLVTLARFVEGQALPGTPTPTPIPTPPLTPTPSPSPSPILSPSPSPSAVACSQFGASASGQCVEYTSYPTQINGVNVDLYDYSDGWTTPNPTGDLNIAAIGDALRNVIPLYSTFAPPFNVTIALVKSFNNINNTNLAETTAVLPAGTPCHVLILQQPNNGTDPSFYLEHITTHELYHCVEFRNQENNLPDIDGSGWWVEGSAEYFADKFYRDNGPQSYMKAYDPNVALYKQAPTLRASIFFQFLSNQGWSDDTINGFVTQQYRDAQAGGLERSIMSNNVDLQRLFPIFAQKFSGLAITFPDGSLAQGNPGKPITETKIVLNDLQSDGQQHTTVLRAVSFAMNMYTAALQPGITYSIQWAPSAQDTKTVLAYQQPANISGNTWTTINPGTPIQIPIDCSSDPVQYEFLLTSTADEDVSQGQLTIERQSSQPCGCNDVGISLDPCLSGNWTLDLNDFQTYLKGRLVALKGVTVTDLVASGASTFEFPEGGMGGMIFDILNISYNTTASGYFFHTTIDLTGSVSGQPVMKGPGQFCWADGQGGGRADTSTTVLGLGGPYDLYVPLATAYAAPTITVNYTCSATSLQLVGSDNGQYGL